MRVLSTVRLSRAAKFVLVAVCVGMQSSSTEAATYYVRMSGNDSNAGTSTGAAFRNISKAADTAVAGDTVYVGAGTYTSADATPNNNGTSASPIVFVADTTGTYTGDAGTVDFQKQWNLGGKDYWTIRGFKISTDTTKAGILASGCLGLVVENCTITSRLQGVAISGTSSAAISGCTITGNSNDGIEINSGNSSTTVTISNCRLQSNSAAGLYAKKATVTVKNCLITNNQTRGIWDDNDAATIVSIWNCTISDNTQDGLRVSGGTTTIRNCAVTYNGAFGLNRSGGTLNNSYNDVFSNTSGNYSGTSAGTGSISSNPLYVDRANGDYTFSNTSPLLNSGTSAAGTVDDDLRGRVRPIGSSWDMSCYEASPTGTLLFVVSSATSPTSQETARRTLVQSWGYYAQLIDDDASQASFDSAVLGSKVVYISEEANSASFGTKLRSSAIGIVNEEPAANDEFGFSSGMGTTTGSSLTITNGTHYITSTLGAGSVTIFTSSQPIGYLAGTFASEMQVLAQWGANRSLVAIENGAELYDGSTAAGRRVQLPWGDSAFDFTKLNANGQALLKRSLEWASGLVGYWKLDETSGSTASDYSGYRNHGTVAGGLSFATDSVNPGKLGRGLMFNGSSDYISINNATSLQPTTALTIAAWIKGDTWGTSSYANTILRKGEDNPNNWQLAIAGGGKVQLSLDDNDDTGFRGNTTLQAGTWYHVAATWDGTTVRIYVNGVLDRNPPQTQSSPIGADSRAVYLGGRSGSTDFFDGVIDDVRIYNYALDPSEITALKGYGQTNGIRVLKWVEVQ